MKCPKCEEDMEFEEVKNFSGVWYCDCGYESNGERIPCDADMTDAGTYIATDFEEKIEK